jgi:hypothetical protein
MFEQHVSLIFARIFILLNSSEPNEHGFFRIWFPLLASRVEKIALQAHQALQAASVPAV